MRITRALAVVLGLVLSACAVGAAPSAGPTSDGGRTIVAGPPGGGRTIVAKPPGSGNGSGSAPAPGAGSGRGSAPTAPAVPYDPREGGLEIGLAEWAVTLEAAVIRPGRVTFVIHNGGTRAHGFEIEDEANDSSGHGRGDGLKTEGELLGPGGREEITLDLAPGLYKVECLVDGHDDLGMEIMLEVREDAPLVTPKPASPDAVAIAGVKFQPAELSVPPGTEVTWTNEDPTPHTVTADQGASFDSGIMETGGTFRWTFETSGTVTYYCAIHPDMRGSITVG